MCPIQRLGTHSLGSEHEVVMRKLGLIIGAGALAIVVVFAWWIFSRPERGTTGSVSTRFHLLGPNDKIVVDGFDDPKVEGVACHISRAQTGGLKRCQHRLSPGRTDQNYR
jgi:catabolite regulation protein CreA